MAVSQTTQTDSLKRLLLQTAQDSNRVLLLTQLDSNYRFFNPDSSMVFVQQAMRLAVGLNFNKGKVQVLNIFGEARRFRGEFPEALEAQFDAMQISKSIGYQEGEAASLVCIGLVYNDLNEYHQGLNYLYQAKKIIERTSNKLSSSSLLTGIGYAYEKMNMLDSALIYQQQAQISLSFFPRSTIGSLVLTRLGGIQSKLGNYNLALQYFHEAIKISNVTGDILNRGRTQYRKAELYHKINQPDSSLYYCRLAYANGEKISAKTVVLDASSLLVKLYKAKNNLDSAFHYQQVAMAAKDSLFGPQKFQRLQLLMLTEQKRVQKIQQHQKEIEQEQEKYKNKISMYALLATVGVFLLLAIILYRNNRHKQKANALLQNQKEEIDQQRAKAERALDDLTSAQAQLIQSEKMASLGELTAGIAHEIQNPLNFVNNFSEVSAELLYEMIKALDNDDAADAKDIANDVIQNLEKINHHGKRADVIVKGMLQHSRSSTSQKEPTDINKLADEYLRLCYHGLRAKDPSFNVTMQTDFDNTIGKINVIPQDIGRVILNLLTNAFYAVMEKKKEQKDSYEPTVSVTTKRIGDKVIIKVADNGNGIPQKVLNKIFQPFFTTKPTGQGTGLGLSLSYDIIKAHGGEIKVETKEGEWTEFIIHCYKIIID
jgi:signal transduction histidine kinase